jgi:hypothetical protein
MVTTRSQNKPASKPANPPRKRKAPNAKAEVATSNKKRISAETKSSSTKDASEPIIINRAPVLHLWAASVAYFTHPSLPWSTCLSAGAAVSAICAISKRRAIGVMEPKDKGETAKKERKEEQGFEEVEVMRFKLRIKDGKAYVGDKPQTDKENNLKSKFGDRYYEVRRAFDAALRSWEGKQDELMHKAFSMYEHFRPLVKSGWGRQGELDLSMVEDVVSTS